MNKLLFLVTYIIPGFRVLQILYQEQGKRERCKSRSSPPQSLPFCTPWAIKIWLWVLLRTKYVYLFHQWMVFEYPKNNKCTSLFNYTKMQHHLLVTLTLSSCSVQTLSASSSMKIARLMEVPPMALLEGLLTNGNREVHYPAPLLKLWMRSTQPPHDSPSGLVFHPCFLDSLLKKLQTDGNSILTCRKGLSTLSSWTILHISSWKDAQFWTCQIRKELLILN